MRKILIIIFIVLFSCREEPKKQNVLTFYYPLKENFAHSNLVKIKLDNSNSNFKNITDKANDKYTVDSIPYVEIIDKKILRKIILFRNDGNPIALRNKLEITEDSIITDNGYPIHDLYEILEKYYLSNGNNPNYPENANKVFVEIEIDTSKKGEILNKSIINLVRTFDKINSKYSDTLQLKIALSYFHQIPPPEPPPHYKKN